MYVGPIRFGSVTTSPKKSPGSRLTDKTGNGNLRPPWKKGKSGNPKGGPKGGGRKTFEALVNRALDKEVPGHGITKREALAELFVNQLLAKKNEAAFGHFIRRGWPEVSKHEISADVDMNAEMQIAAEELRRMLGEES